jgi:hypothetical protein
VVPPDARTPKGPKDDQESFTLAVGIGWENVEEHDDPKSVF